MIKRKASHWKIRIKLDSYHTDLYSIESEIRDEFISPRVGVDIWCCLEQRINELTHQFPNMSEVRLVETGDRDLKDLTLWRK